MFINRIIKFMIIINENLSLNPKGEILGKSLTATRLK